MMEQGQIIDLFNGFKKGLKILKIRIGEKSVAQNELNFILSATKILQENLKTFHLVIENVYTCFNEFMKFKQLLKGFMENRVEIMQI